jgi:hypothetical protein
MKGSIIAGGAHMEIREIGEGSLISGSLISAEHDSPPRTWLVS